MTRPVGERLLNLADRLYGAALWGFPREFRSRFGREMREAFRRGCGAALDRGGVPGMTGYVMRALLDVMREAPPEHVTVRRYGPNPRVGPG